MLRTCKLLALGLPLTTAAFATEPPGSIRLLRSEMVVEADGRAVQTVHVEIAVNNDAAARQEAQQAAAYSEGVETVELAEGVTIKSDGRRVPVPPGGVRTQLAPGCRREGQPLEAADQTGW